MSDFVNQFVDQQSLDEDRDDRKFGNFDFDFIGKNADLKPVDEEGDAW